MSRQWFSSKECPPYPENMSRQRLSSKEFPPSPGTLPETWRHIPWGHKETDLEFMRNYQPHNKELEHLRILLYGPTGHGKSSFINSVDSVFQGRMAGRATTDAVTQGGFTKKYRNYKIQKDGPETFYHFVFNDIMGIEKEANSGVNVEDIKLAMMGHIQDGYKFNPCSKISEDDKAYNKSPALHDRVHVLVSVISATTLAILTPETVRKMREARLAASEMGIPQLAILTKIDEACPEVKKDVKNAYKNKYLKEKMEELSRSLGLPPKCIFLVKNYHSETDTDDDTDTLILHALRHMINFGEDFVNNL